MFEEILYYYGNQILGAVMCAICGLIGYAAKQLCARYINDDAKRSVARSAVLFVEQTWKDIHGKDKLHKALEAAEKLLAKKGIKFDADEMELLIEAAVGEMNKYMQSQSVPVLFHPVDEITQEE